nr:unnamed protein product [Spirometra erinaceieuropaei]
MLSSLYFEQLNSSTYPMGTFPLCWRFGSTWKIGLDYHEEVDDKDPLFSPDEPATQMLLRRRKRKQKLDKSRRKSTPPLCNSRIPEDQAISLPIALRQSLVLKTAQLSNYSRLFSQQLGFPANAAEGYERMPSIPPPPPHRPLETEHKLLAQLQRLFHSRYARLNEVPSFRTDCQVDDDDDHILAGGAVTQGEGAEEEETRTVVTYISLTDQHPQADPNGCPLTDEREVQLDKGGGEFSASGQYVLTSAKSSRLRIPGRHSEQKRHISWKDLALGAAVTEGSVRRMLVSPVLPTTDAGDLEIENKGSGRRTASGLNSDHQQTHPEPQGRPTFSCSAELNSQLTMTPREDRHRMQIQQIKRLIASQRRCHKWFFTLYEFDKPENAEETAKLESSLFDIIINRLHWIYALSVSDLFIPSGRDARPAADTHSSPHDNTILTKFAVTQQQVDKRLRFKVRRLSRHSLGVHTDPATQSPGHQRHLNRHHHHHHHYSTGLSRKRLDPARNLFAYSLLQDQSPSSRTHSLERGSGGGPPQVLPTPSISPLQLNTDVTSHTTVPTSRISCVHYAMFSRLSPRNPGQLICGGEVSGRGESGVDTASKIYCSDCGRNMIGCSSVASTVGSSDFAGSSQRRLMRRKCSSSDDSLLYTSRSGVMAQAPATAQTTICYAMSRSVEFCSTLRQLKSEQSGHLPGRRTQHLPYNSPVDRLLEPQWWPHHGGIHRTEPTYQEVGRTHTTEHPRKRRRRCRRDQRSASNAPLPNARDQLPQGEQRRSSSPPDSETKRRIQSRKLRHWLQKRLGQRRVEDWLNTSWTTDETLLSAE